MSPDYKASTCLLFSKNNIFTLEKLLLFNRGVYMYKILNNLAPNYLYDIFSKCTNAGGKNLRSCSNENFNITRYKIRNWTKSIILWGKHVKQSPFFNQECEYLVCFQI